MGCRQVIATNSAMVDGEPRRTSSQPAAGLPHLHRWLHIRQAMAAAERPPTCRQKQKAQLEAGQIKPTCVGRLEERLVKLVGAEHVCIQPDRPALALPKLAAIGLKQQREGQPKALFRSRRSGAVAAAARRCRRLSRRLAAAAAAGRVCCCACCARCACCVLWQAQHAAHEVGTGQDVAPLVAAAHLHLHAVLPPHVHKVVAL